MRTFFTNRNNQQILVKHTLSLDEQEQTLTFRQVVQHKLHLYHPYSYDEHWDLWDCFCPSLNKGLDQTDMGVIQEGLQPISEKLFQQNYEVSN